MAPAGSLSVIVTVAISSLAMASFGLTAQIRPRLNTQHDDSNTRLELAARTSQTDHDYHAPYPPVNQQYSKSQVVFRSVRSEHRLGPIESVASTNNRLNHKYAGDNDDVDRHARQALTTDSNNQLGSASSTRLNYSPSTTTTTTAATTNKPTSTYFDTHDRANTQSSSIAPAALISATTMPSVQNDSSTQYATINYNGLIGVNATDPYAFTTESRNFMLPIEIQILMCLLYGTLAFTAIASNMIVCYIVLSNQRMRTATNYFIVNLAVGDILMALLCIPFTFPANLIFQSWPFGLSLCVIVSYSQANSVFISAYTMVAISIDKYIAIMYPMRLRMLKNQAKMIILVIWSAALVTSLPTALLSSLEPGSPDLGPPQPTPTTTTPATILASSPFGINLTTTNAKSNNNDHNNSGDATTESLISASKNLSTRSTEDYIREQATTIIMNKESQQQKLLTPSRDNPAGTIASSKTSSPSTAPPLASQPTTSLSTSTTSEMTNQQQQQQQLQQEPEEQRKYFCQESWTFWPGGKYYYSMALMVLQFVLPLFVLVITYSRIVIVVWGKRMPGEEDNARDARMARSKRKMIKMVIFCVIAFALTWLPFNALIVIGDMHPVVWEHQNIMYIWFITHYLAMCHTITNPLIYIWMNNRFRAGFKQVISDICKYLQRILAYIICYCLCLGCCFNCSRQKYARVAMEIDRKRGGRGPLTSSGSTNPQHNYTNHANINNSNQHNLNTANATGHTNTNNHTTSTGAALTSSKHDSVMQVTGTSRRGDSRRLGSGTSVGVSIDSQGTTSERPYSLVPIRSGEPSDLNEQSRTVDATRDRSASIDRRDENDRHISNSSAHNGTVRDGMRQVISDISNDTTTGERLAGVQQQTCTLNHRGLRHFRMFRRFRGGGDNCGVCIDKTKTKVGEDEDDVNPSRVKTLGNSRKTGKTKENAAAQAHQNAAPAARKKRRRKRTHAISLQMTTSEFYPTNHTVINSAYKTTNVTTNQQQQQQQQQQHKSAACTHSARESNNTHAAGKLRIRRFKSSSSSSSSRRKFSTQVECPSCLRESSNVVGVDRCNQQQQQQQQQRVNSMKANCSSNAYYVVDMRQSSQSTATISAQTNNTSLAISPWNSARGSGGDVAKDGNNTSASLSEHGSGTCLRSPRGQVNQSGSVFASPVAAAVAVAAAADAKLSGNQEARSSAVGADENVLCELTGGSTDEQQQQQQCDSLIERQETAAGLPSSKLTLCHVVGRDQSTDESCCAPPDRTKVTTEADDAVRSHGEEDDDDESAKLLPSCEAAATYATATTKLRDSGGTLSEATSLEGHQLASSRSAASNTVDFIATHQLPITWRLRVNKFCAQHRQTVSAADHRHLLAMSCDDEIYSETDGDGEDVGVEDEVEDDGHERAPSVLKANGRLVHKSKSGAGKHRKGGGARVDEIKSSSAFELVSDYLLQGARLETLDASCNPNGYSATNRKHDMTTGSVSSNERDGDDEDEEDEEEDEEVEDLVAEYGDPDARCLVSFQAGEIIQLQPISRALDQYERKSGDDLVTAGATTIMPNDKQQQQSTTLIATTPKTFATDSSASTFIDFCDQRARQTNGQLAKVKSLAEIKFTAAASMSSPICLRRANGEHQFYRSHLVGFASAANNQEAI